MVPGTVGVAGHACGGFRCSWCYNHASKHEIQADAGLFSYYFLLLLEVRRIGKVT